MRQKKIGNQMKRLHQQRKRLNQKLWQGFAEEYQPEIRFDGVATLFQNYLHGIKRIDYTIDELTTFIPQYVTFREQLRQMKKDCPTPEELNIFMMRCDLSAQH